MKNKGVLAATIIVIFIVVLLFANNKAVTNARTVEDKPVNTTSTTDNSITSTASTTNTSGLIELKTEVIQEGTGDRVVKAGDKISVNYIGTLKDGTKFDSSYDRNQAFDFTVGNSEVIQGWDQGTVGMKLGEKRRLSIPSSLGYGNQAMGSIPANSDLYFDVELVKFDN